MKNVLIIFVILISNTLWADQASDLLDELKLITEAPAENDAQLPQKVKDLFNSSHLKDQEPGEDYVNLSQAAPVRGKDAPNINHLKDPQEQIEMQEMMLELHKDGLPKEKTKKTTRSKSGWRVR